MVLDLGGGGLFGDNGLFKPSPDDGQVDTAAGNRTIPEDQTEDTHELDWKAEWVSGTTYAIDNWCEYRGTAYKCILGNTNQIPPNVTYWELVSSDSLLVDGVAKHCLVNPATGTMLNPSELNDGIFLGTGNNATADTIGKYAEIAFDNAVRLKRFRQYGHTYNNGDGVWKVQYFNIYTAEWIDWITGLSTRTTKTWSDYSTGAVIITSRIRLVCTTVDTFGSGYSSVTEIEVIL